MNLEEYKFREKYNDKIVELGKEAFRIEAMTNLKLKIIIKVNQNPCTPINTNTHSLIFNIKGKSFRFHNTIAI